MLTLPAMPAATITQIRPSQSEALAQEFEALASQARSGEIIGYSAVILRPGGRYSHAGWSPNEGHNLLEQIGIHVTSIVDIVLHSRQG